MTLTQLDAAMMDLMRAKKHCSHNNSIWSLSFEWAKERLRLLSAYASNTYHISPQKAYYIEGRYISCFEAKDGVIFRVLKQVLSDSIVPNFSRLCTHLKGFGGLKLTVNSVYHNLGDYKYFYKTDIMSYYHNIDHDILLQKLGEFSNDLVANNIVKQYCSRIEWQDGNYYHHKKGIPKGCALSPLMGALYLNDLDKSFEGSDVYYVRYMDDILIMAKTSWQLKNARNKLYKHLNKLNLETRPEKTEGGKTTTGFDFLGYHIAQDGLSCSKKTLDKARDKISKLIGQGASNTCIRMYCSRFYNWLIGSVKEVLVKGTSQVTLEHQLFSCAAITTKWSKCYEIQKF
jgi:RNA-directed DNA polymerase